jgi:threonine aldolase
MHVIDLRSDTVTRPSTGMRRAMAEAEVGDDGYGEDPTVRALEEGVARMLGHEAGLFVASGTMGNQVALRTLTAPGEVVVVGRRAHLVQFELGASARNAGVQFVTLPDDPGFPDPDEVARAIAEYRTLGHPVALVALENTHMPSGGRPIDLGALAALRAAADGTPVYVDGARLWNAAVALEVPPARLVEGTVLVSTCLSKGLGAPMGSVVVGDHETIARARRERARLGGRLRQAGIVAAGGCYALDHHLERLRDDHARAQRLGALIGAQLPRDRADCLEVPTNVLLVRVPHPQAALGALRERGVLANVLPGGVLRFVTHLDVDDDDIDVAAARIVEVLGRLP